MRLAAQDFGSAQRLPGYAAAVSKEEQDDE